MNEPGQKKPFWKQPRLPRLTWKRAVLTAAGCWSSSRSRVL